MRWKTSSLLALIGIFVASSLIGKSWTFSNEANFPSSIQEAQALFKKEPVRTFKGVPHQGSDLALEYKSWIHPNPIAQIIILHGFSENFVKYTELIYDFYRNGFSVYMYNQRGHGNSQLLDHKAIFVEDFDHYVNDLEIFVQGVTKASGKASFLFAHSMGGGVAARFLERHPQLVDGAALSSPMIGMVTKPFPQWLARGIAQLGCRLGWEQSLAPGQSLPQNNWTFAKSNTSSPIRYQHYEDTTYSQDMEAMRRGGATFGFINESFKATEKIRQTAEIAKIEKPILLFQAELDTWVSLPAQTEFCDMTPFCTRVLLEGAKHEAYHEKDEIRNKMLQQTLYFFAAEAQGAELETSAIEGRERGL